MPNPSPFSPGAGAREWVGFATARGRRSSRMLAAYTWIAAAGLACTLGDADLGIEYAPFVEATFTNGSDAGDTAGQGDETDSDTGDLPGHGPADDHASMDVDDGRSEWLDLGSEIPGCSPEVPPIEVLGGGHHFTIASAIDATPPGGTISVCPGVYPENLYVDRPLTIEGAGAQDTVIDGSLTASVFVVESVDFTLRGVTLRRGSAHVALPDTQEPCGGGLVVLHDRLPQTLELEDVRFMDNHAAFGGGLCVDGHSTSGVDAVLAEVEFIANHATVDGGGLHALGEVTLVDSSFVANVAGHRGGGLVLRYDASTMTGGVVHSNVASGGGGGAFLRHPASLTLDGADWAADPLLANGPDDLACAAASIGWIGETGTMSCWSWAYDQCDCD